jgi:hypothetical protein
MSSKENTSHLNKGRHMTFIGFRCMVASTPHHSRGSAHPTEEVSHHSRSSAHPTEEVSPRAAQHLSQFTPAYSLEQTLQSLSPKRWWLLSAVFRNLFH